MPNSVHDTRIPRDLQHSLACTFDTCSIFCKRREWVVYNPAPKPKKDAK